MEKHVDILIIGAGISGLGLAAHLSKICPQRQFDIIERRESFGGTWDLFKYPGIRSDSDMSTFGYNFKPWQKSNVLADGSAIKNYLSEVVDEYQLKNKIHFKHRVISANYDSSLKKWLVKIEDQQQNNRFGLPILYWVVLGIIIMIMAFNLIFQIKKPLKVKSFTHNIGQKILITVVKKWSLLAVGQQRLL